MDGFGFDRPFAQMVSEVKDIMTAFWHNIHPDKFYELLVYYWYIIGTLC